MEEGSFDEENEEEEEEVGESNNNFSGYHEFFPSGGAPVSGGGKLQIDPDANLFEPEEVVLPLLKQNVFDASINRPSLTVIDSVSYYNLGALCVLLYGHVTEGIKTPSIFDKEKQTLVIKDPHFDF